jgi:hypothetical protein
LWALLRSPVVDRAVLSVAAGGAMGGVLRLEGRGSTTAPDRRAGVTARRGRTGAAGQPRIQTALDT